MKLKQILTVTLILAVMFFIGFGIGKLASSIMIKSKAESGYIGKSGIKIENGQYTPEAMLSMGRLSDPQLSPDGHKILYGVSYTSIADNRSCRNLFLCNTDGSGNVQLTRYAKSVTNARWSADGSEIFFVQGGQIWKAAFKGNRLGKKVQISDVPAGIGEFKLSPDQSRIIYTSTIHSSLQTPSDSDPALDKAQAYATEDLMYRHWDHWVTEIPRSYVAPFNGETIIPENSIDILGDEGLFELPTEPFGGIEQLDWSPDGKYIAYSCRKLTGKKYAFSTDTEIYLYCLESGECTRIPMDGGYDTDPVWSPDGSMLAWLSMPRDGYESDKTRVMVAEIELADGKAPVIRSINDLTADFDYDAAGPVWNGTSSAIMFSSLADGLQGLFYARLSQPGEITRVTSEDWWFDFSSPWAVKEDEDGGIHLLASYYSLNFPTELVDVTIGREKGDISYTQITHENDHILSQLAPVETEKRYIKTVDGKDMLTWVMYPPEFNKDKVYPSILITLGGPQGSISQDWSYRWNYRLMASQGYVVVLPNRRGTTAFGQEWKEQISGDYTGLNMQDYLSAAREMKAEPYIGKMAACGASYGGYSVYYLAGIHGDVFDCFIAHAGIFNEKELWFTTEEMWFANWDNGGLHEAEFDPALGTPGCPVGPKGDGKTFGGIKQGGAPYSDTPKALHHYANSPEANVTKWHTPILCIHGGMDFRIPYTQGMGAFNAAQMMGVPSKLIVFPEETHWVLQPQNSLYWHREYFNWLERWIK